jgi:hypothetical protein
MPLFVQQFDSQIRFVLKGEMKARLYREAKRRGCQRPISCGSTSRRGWHGVL